MRIRQILDNFCVKLQRGGQNSKTPSGASGTRERDCPC